MGMPSTKELHHCRWAFSFELVFEHAFDTLYHAQSNRTRCGASITNAARNISTVSGPRRAVRHPAGYFSLQTTQRYIDGDSAAKEAGGGFGLTERRNCI